MSYPEENGAIKRVANKISGNIFVIQISSVTKLKGHLMKNKRCRWGLCISEKQARTSLQAILANSASSQPCPTTNTSIITNLKTTTTNITNITIPLYYHHHPSHLPFRSSANDYQRHQRQILTSNMYINYTSEQALWSTALMKKDQNDFDGLVMFHVPSTYQKGTQVALILRNLQLFFSQKMISSNRKVSIYKILTCDNFFSLLLFLGMECAFGINSK